MKADHTQVTRLLKTARGQIDGILKMIPGIELEFRADTETLKMFMQSFRVVLNRLHDRISCPCLPVTQ